MATVVLDYTQRLMPVAKVVGCLQVTALGSSYRPTLAQFDVWKKSLYKVEAFMTCG